MRRKPRVVVGEPDPTLKQNAIIIDLDGTLAKHAKRDWHEYDKLDTDEIIDHVHEIAVAMSKQGYAVLMLTGRPGQYRQMTIEWLIANDVPYNAVYMRGPRDNRSNQAFKEDAYHQFIEPFYDVLFVIEDNPHVVKMFRDLGIPVLDVGSTFGGE